MKDYKQVSDSVFRKAEERMNEKKRRAAAIWRRSIIASGMAAVLLVGVGVWKNESIRGLLKRDPHSSEISVIEEETTGTATVTMAVTTETVSVTAEKTTKQTKTTAATAIKTSSGTSAANSTASSSTGSTSSEKTDENTSRANGGGTTVRTEQNNNTRTTVITSADKNTTSRTIHTTSGVSAATTTHTSTTTSTTTRRTNTTTTRQTYVPTYIPTATTTTERIDASYTAAPITTTNIYTNTNIQTTTTTTTTTLAHTTIMTTTSIATEHEFKVTETEPGKWLIEGCPVYCGAFLYFEFDGPIHGTMHITYHYSDHEETSYDIDLGKYDMSWLHYYNYGPNDTMTVYYECDDPSKMRLIDYKLDITYDAIRYYNEKNNGG